MAPDALGADTGAFAGLTAREAQASLGRLLESAGIEGAARDARLLLLEALGLSATDLVRAPERRVSESEAQRLADFARRRMAHEPVSRIVGTRGFYGRTFRITPATLDPRPCTETVVDAALEVADREGWRERPIRILDVGTGSGALLVTLLAELPLATGVGTDISDGALDAARDNAQRLGVAHRATFLNRRTLDGVEGTFHLLVSNPPYIPTGDIATLAPEVRDFDPTSALDGGADGLDIYRALAQGVDAVVPAGWVLVEVGAGQAAQVEEIFRNAAAGGRAGKDIKLWKDLGQHVRCVAVRTQF
jgi:release factor glutamine methyltransferase